MSRNRRMITQQDLEAMHARLPTALNSIRVQRILRLPDFPEFEKYLVREVFPSYDFPNQANHSQRRGFADYVLWLRNCDHALTQRFPECTAEQVIKALTEGLAKIGILPPQKISPELRDLEREWSGRYKELFGDAAKVDAIEQENLDLTFRVKTLESMVLTLEAKLAQATTVVQEVPPTMRGDVPLVSQSGLTRVDAIEFLKATRDYFDVQPDDSDVRVCRRRIDDVLTSLARERAVVPESGVGVGLPFSEYVAKAINTWEPHYLWDDKRSGAAVKELVIALNVTLAQLIEMLALRYGHLKRQAKKAAGDRKISRQSREVALWALEELYERCQDPRSQSFSCIKLHQHMVRQAEKNRSAFTFV